MNLFKKQQPPNYDRLLKKDQSLKFVLQICRTRQALDGQIGVELEGMPADGGRETRLVGAQSRQRGFELALADVAPGADNVGDDVDQERRANQLGGGG